MPHNNFLGHEPKKPSCPSLGDSDISKKQEKRIAKRSGGRRQPGSGSCDHSKGDVKADKILFECKTTNEKSIRVEKKWLIKISREASAQQRDPCLVASFPEMPSGIERDWAILPMKVLRCLIDKAEELDQTLLEGE
jgi:hypothetical protein